MLQTQTVQPELLELLKALMSVELFNNFYVVGDTALALQVGHRQSIDIDLFGQSEMGIRRQWPTAKRQLLNSYAVNEPEYPTSMPLKKPWQPEKPTPRINHLTFAQ